MRVRTAGPEDLPALRGIYRRASLSNPHDAEALLARPDLLVLTDAEVLAGHTRVAVDASGALVGFATSVGTGVVRELEDLFVEPHLHRHGVGALLVADAVARLRSQGAQRLDVVANPEAGAFYDAVGFERDGEVRTELGTGIRMHLDLTTGGRG